MLKKRQTSLLLILTVMYVVSFFPSFIYSMYANRQAQDKWRASYQSLNNSECAMLTTRISNDIEHVHTQINQLMNMSTLLRYTYYDESAYTPYERNEMAKQLYEQLLWIVSGSQYAKDVTLVLSDHQEAISSSKGVRRLTDEQLAAVHSRLGDPQQVMTYSNTEISFLHTNTFSRKRLEKHTPSVILISTFSTEKISSVLREGLSQSAGEGAYMLYGGEMRLITQSALGEGVALDDILSILEQKHTEVRGSGLRALGQRFYVSRGYASPYALELVKITPEKALPDVGKSYEHAWFMILALMLLSVLCFVLFLMRYVYWPIHDLLDAFRKTEQGESPKIGGRAYSQEFGELFFGFNHMIEQLNAHIRDKYRLRLLISQAEIKQLQYQINPHFLYNSFYMLRALLEEEDYERSSLLADHLGDYFQYVTTGQGQFVPLSEELRHAYSYAQIQQMRHAQKLSIHMQPIRPEDEKILVPRLILQPLIENAVIHGIDLSRSGQVIRISVMSDESGMLLSVENTDAGFTEEKIERVRMLLSSADAKSVALYNINKRIGLIYGEGCGLRVQRSAELGGLQMTIVIKGEPHVGNSDCGR